jgi:hypothetical protein
MLRHSTVWSRGSIQAASPKRAVSSAAFLRCLVPASSAVEAAVFRVENDPENWHQALSNQEQNRGCSSAHADKIRPPPAPRGSDQYRVSPLAHLISLAQKPHCNTCSSNAAEHLVASDSRDQKGFIWVLAASMPRFSPMQALCGFASRRLQGDRSQTRLSSARGRSTSGSRRSVGQSPRPD